MLRGMLKNMKNDIKIIEKLASRVKIYLFVIALLLVVICVLDAAFIVPSIVFYVLLIIYTAWVNTKKKTEIESHIEEVTWGANSAIRNTLNRAPIPMVIIETDGNIVYKNPKVNNEFKSIDITTYLDSIIKEIKLELENNADEKKKEIIKQISINNKTYKIYCEYSMSKKRDKRKRKEYVLSLYFIDDTKYNSLFDKYISEKTCIGIAVVDNYEEIAQRIAPEERTQVLAQVEKAIYDWASGMEGLVVKNDRDSFICLFEQKYLMDLEKNKVNILDTVKELDSKVPITLSISISNEGENFYERYKSALAGVDLVLGRGGDQAIVRKEGKYKFYGGTSLEVEKRTKVKARIVAHSLEGLIIDSKNVIIMGHKNTDIDSLGSSLGIYRLAKTLNKDAYIVNEDFGMNLGTFVDTLKSVEEYNEAIIDPKEAVLKTDSDSLIVVVDTHKKSYVQAPELLDKTEKIVVIDHHRKSPDFIENASLTFHEVYASSAAELVTELIQYVERDVELTQIELESLYGGIMVDTKNFTFKTGVRTFEAAAYLRKFGVDIIKVKKWFQSDLESYNEIAEIIKRAEIIENSIAISINNIEGKDANTICAKAADELLTISNITASFVIGNTGENICISGRSIGDINVQVILEKLGGGGHMTLAGAQLEGVTIEEAKSELIIRINEYLTETNV